MLKINFIIHLFLEMLHFKESWNLIGQQHFGSKLKNQNFPRFRIGGETPITILVFTVYFQEKLINFFQKILKTLL